MLSIVNAESGESTKTQKISVIVSKKRKKRIERADGGEHRRRKVPQLECTIGHFFSTQCDGKKIGSGGSAGD